MLKAAPGINDEAEATKPASFSSLTDSIGLSSNKGNSSLRDHITDILAQPLESSIPALRDILDTGLEAGLTYTGIRTITHPFYRGTYSLNSLARAWMGQSHKLRESSTPQLPLRLMQYSLLRKFQGLYADSKKAVKGSKFAWFFAAFRDVSLGCSCCSGDPLFCIPYDERCDEALYFKPEVWEECFGNIDRKYGSMSWSEGGMLQNRFKCEESMIKDAIKRLDTKT